VPTYKPQHMHVYAAYVPLISDHISTNYTNSDKYFCQKLVSC